MILVPFSLEWSAPEHAALHPAQQAAFARRVVEFWASHGVVVVLGGSDGRTRFLEAIEALPQQARICWKSAIKRFQERIVFADAPEIEDIIDLEGLAPITGTVALLGASDERCDLLGLDAEEIARSLGGGHIEVARVLCLCEAPSALRARHEASRELERGTMREQIWEERFEPLVRYSRQLVVVDRYCGVDALRHASDRASGLEFVLRQIWRKDLRVKIMMASPRANPGQDHDDVLAAFRGAIVEMADRLAMQLGPRSRDLEIIRLRDKTFGEMSHDRYLRFSSWVYRLDVGLESFSGTGPRRERSPCELVHCAVEQLRGRQMVEARLADAAEGVYSLASGRTRDPRGGDWDSGAGK